MPVVTIYLEDILSNEEIQEDTLSKEEIQESLEDLSKDKGQNHFLNFKYIFHVQKKVKKRFMRDLHNSALGYTRKTYLLNKQLHQVKEDQRIDNLGQTHMTV